MKLSIATIAAISTALVFVVPAGAAQSGKGNAACKVQTTIVKGKKITQEVCKPSPHKAAASKTQQKPSGKKP